MDKEMKMASAPDPMDERNSMLEILAERFYKKKLKDLTDDEYDNLIETLPDFDVKTKPVNQMQEIEGQEKDLNRFLIDVQEELMDALLYIEAAKRCLTDEIEEAMIKRFDIEVHDETTL